MVINPTDIIHIIMKLMEFFGLGLGLLNVATLTMGHANIALTTSFLGSHHGVWLDQTFSSLNGKQLLQSNQSLQDIFELYFLPILKYNPH